jgi:hypothetical protein
MAKLEDILESWKKDSVIDSTDLATESLKTSTLHAKYYELYVKESLLLSQKEIEYKRLFKLKSEYYNGRLSTEELKQYNWEPFQLKLMKQDLDTYISGDDDVINTLLHVSVSKEKVDLLKDILKSIHNRGYLIKNAVEFLKFSSGF